MDWCSEHRPERDYRHTQSYEIAGRGWTPREATSCTMGSKHFKDRKGGERI